MPLVHRRLPLLAALSVLLLLGAYLAVTPGRAAAAGALLSQGRPVTASSTENATFPASAAVDGNTGTRWSSAFADPQWVQVDLGATATIDQVTLNWEAAFARSFQIQVSDSATGPFTTVFSTTTGAGGIQTLAVSGSGRFVRMNGTARATAFGYSLFEFQVFGTPAAATCGTANAALGHPATASTVENAGTPAGAAFDGNGATRWSSAFADPQWVQVDLGATATVCGVTLTWEAAFARSFQIQVAPAATGPFTTIFLDHDRRRRDADADRERVGPVRPDERDRAGDRVRLLAVRARGAHDRAGDAAPAAAVGHLLGRPHEHPGGRERADGQGAQPHQRPVPGQPGLLDVQRADPLDRGTALPGHAGQLGRSDDLPSRLADQPVHRLHRVHRRAGRVQRQHHPGRRLRAQAGPAAALPRRDGPAGRRGPGDLRAEPGGHIPAVRRRGAGGVRRAGPGRGPGADPVTGQRPGLPGRRGQRQLLQRVRRGQRGQRPDLGHLRLRRHPGPGPDPLRRAEPARDPAAAGAVGDAVELLRRLPGQLVRQVLA